MLQPASSQHRSIARRLPLVLLVVVLLALAAAASGLASARSASDYPTLFVTFNPDMSVTVADQNGNPVGTASGPPTVIAPGTYNISISDTALVSDVQWDLAGPGVKLVTTMSSGEEPSETWVETFLPSSTYTYRDDLRPPAFWTFVTSNTAAVGTAGSGSAPTTTTTAPVSSGTTGSASSTDVVGSGIASTPFRGTLAGAVSAAGTLTLKLKGKAVGSLESGRYRITVTDRSRKSGFTLQEIRQSGTTITTTSFVGTKSVTIDLKPGQWFYYPTFVGKKSYFVVTSR